MAKDLSNSRATHMSAPLNTGDIEFHLQHKEVKAPEPKKKEGSFWVRFPVNRTDLDDKGHRYQAAGLPDVLPRNEPPAKPLKVQKKFKQNKQATQIYRSDY